LDGELHPEDGRVEWAESDNAEEWDDFVARNGGSLFQMWPWRRVLENADSRPLYLACRNSEGNVIAVCPFIYRSGRRLLYLDSLPDTPTAGPLVGHLAGDPSQVIASLPKSVKFSLFNPVVAMYIKAHQPQVIEPMIALGYRYATTHGLFILDLRSASPDHIWNNGFNKHDRQAVKYYDARAKFEFAKSENDYLALEKPNWRHFKGRLFHADFISKMRTVLGDRIQVGLVTDSDDKALSGLLMLFDPPESPGPGLHLLAVRHSARRNIHSPVTFINWKVVNWANEHGYRYIDFGSFSKAPSIEPAHPFYKLKKRFEITYVPRYLFTLPTSSVSYSIARRIRRML
jgi:hypothetical protein